MSSPPVKVHLSTIADCGLLMLTLEKAGWLILGGVSAVCDDVDTEVIHEAKRKGLEKLADRGLTPDVLTVTSRPTRQGKRIMVMWCAAVQPKRSTSDSTEGQQAASSQAHHKADSPKASRPATPTGPMLGVQPRKGKVWRGRGTFRSASRHRGVERR